MPFNEENFIKLQLALERIDARLEDVREIKSELKQTRQQVSELQSSVTNIKTEYVNLEEDVKELKEKNTWLTRTVAGAILSAVIGVVLTLF